MGRRFVLLAAVLVLAVSTLSSESAHAASVNATGTLHCAISGKMRFAPGFGYRLATSDSVLRATVSGPCTGTSGVTRMKGRLIAYLHYDFPSFPAENICLSDFNGFPVQFGPVRFTGGAKYAPSRVEFTRSETVESSGTLALDLPADGLSFIPSGSFGGKRPTMTLAFDQNAEDVYFTCQLGKRGLRKLTFGGTSSFDID
jgi:hypothetical protein